MFSRYYSRYELCHENLSLEFPTRSDTNRAVQPQKMTRGMKFRNEEVEGLHYLFYVAKTKA